MQRAVHDRRAVATSVAITVECLAAVALATALVALLDGVAPNTGLEVIYLLAVLFVAIHRGQAPAIGTAVGSVLALNYFFIEPRFQLTIRHAGDVVSLAVFLGTALAVGRLATAARQRAGEAESRAKIAAAREREAAMIAAAASSLLVGGDVEAQLRSIERSSGALDGAPGARIQLGPVPSPEADEVAVRLPTTAKPAWLYLGDDAGWVAQDLDRVAEALARLIDVAFERERLSAQAAEAEATRRADTTKTALLHAISHDLRSPLTAITTAAGGLADESLSAEDRKELVSVIEVEAARLARLVDDLLDLSRIEGDAVHPNPDWCDLHDVVVSATAHVRAQHGDHPVELHLPLDLPLVHADPVQLERVFANLIDNAIKFSPATKPVSISGSVTDHRVVVRVSDQGTGVPRAERTHIFEPFVSGRGAGRGSGLGLAICRGFVEANGGRIVLQAADQGGASFAVSFPVERQPAIA